MHANPQPGYESGARERKRERRGKGLIETRRMYLYP